MGTEPASADADLSAIPLLTLQIDHRQTQWNQEFRLSATEADYNWSIGSFTSFGKTHYDRVLNIFNIPFNKINSQLEDENYSIFGNISYKITDKLALHGGLRLDYVIKRVNRKSNIAARFKQAHDFFYASPKLSVDYQLTDDISLYSSTGLAYKPGGFSPTITNTALSDFNQESMWANELGLKSKWLDNRLQANLALFYYRIEDYQVERNTPTILDYMVVNAEQATSYGLELETKVKLLPELSWEAAFGYTHLRLDRFKDPVSNNSLSGNKAPYVPEKTFMTALHYQHSTGFFARGEWYWNDSVYYDDSNNQAFKQDDYSVLNARLGYQGDYFGLYVFGNNLTNTHYYSFILPSFNAGTPAKPQSFGVKASFDF